jgi:hypothetical protein
MFSSYLPQGLHKIYYGYSKFRKQNLALVEYKDNLLLFSSHSTFDIIMAKFYISIYFILIKK